MIALGGVGRGLHFPEQCVHLIQAHGPPGTHAAVAGHGRANRVEPRLDAAGFAFAEFLHEIADQRLQIAMAQERRRFAHDHGAGSEAFDDEPAIGELAAIFEQSGRVFLRQLDDFRNEQELPGDAAASQGRLLSFS